MEQKNRIKTLLDENEMKLKNFISLVEFFDRDVVGLEEDDRDEDDYLEFENDEDDPEGDNVSEEAKQAIFQMMADGIKDSYEEIKPEIFQEYDPWERRLFARAMLEYGYEFFSSLKNEDLAKYMSEDPDFAEIMLYYADNINRLTKDSYKRDVYMGGLEFLMSPVLLNVMSEELQGEIMNTIIDAEKEKINPYSFTKEQFNALKPEIKKLVSDRRNKKYFAANLPSVSYNENKILKKTTKIGLLAENFSNFLNENEGKKFMEGLISMVRDKHNEIPESLYIQLEDWQKRAYIKVVKLFGMNIAPIMKNKAVIADLAKDPDIESIMTEWAYKFGFNIIGRITSGQERPTIFGFSPELIKGMPEYVQFAIVAEYIDWANGVVPLPMQKEVFNSFTPNVQQLIADNFKVFGIARFSNNE